MLVGTLLFVPAMVALLLTACGLSVRWVLTSFVTLMAIIPVPYIRARHGERAELATDPAPPIGRGDP
jgi:hypothetical protein